MREFTYLQGYPADLLDRVAALIDQGTLGENLRKRYPERHEIRTDGALYDFTQQLKQRYLKSSPPLIKVAYDPKVSSIHNALGIHTYNRKVHGGKIKSSNAIGISSALKDAPLPLLRMLVVHELAHLKEKEHNKAFYQLCVHMEPDYGQLEFDLRLFFTHLELFGPLYEASSTSAKR